MFFVVWGGARGFIDHLSHIDVFSRRSSSRCGEGSCFAFCEPDLARGPVLHTATFYSWNDLWGGAWFPLFLRFRIDIFEILILKLAPVPIFNIIRRLSFLSAWGQFGGHLYPFSHCFRDLETLFCNPRIWINILTNFQLNPTTFNFWGLGTIFRGWWRKIFIR